MITCPRCSGRMVIRLNGKTGKEFYGCCNYPDCKGSRDVPDALVMRAEGVVLTQFQVQTIGWLARQHSPYTHASQDWVNEFMAGLQLQAKIERLEDEAKEDFLDRLGAECTDPNS